jgi:D-alanyl-D-alanine dipeptidase
MKLFLFGCVVFMMLWSCQESAKKTIPIKQTPKKQPSTVLKTPRTLLPEGLVDIQQINASIQIDLKYTTTDNFLREKLYKRLQKAYLQKDVAVRLSEVQKELSRQYPGYQLLIYDAVRPVSVQEKMWKALDSLPVKERIKFVSNPKNLSLHNMGAAVDLTILDANGEALDMGAGFDDIRKIAYPCLEDSFLKVGQLTPLQVQNRKILRNAMQAQGFRQLPTEWWHYNACSREEAKRKYKVLYLEP